jgi:hypothetical protein
MLPHIVSVRQAVKFAKMDLKGKELPGFSLPKKVIGLFVLTMLMGFVFIYVKLQHTHPFADSVCFLLQFC